MVQTNLADIELNYHNILRDFFVFKFETLDKSYKYSYIDEVKQLLQTKAVVYLQGKEFYALFSKKDFKNIHQVNASLDTIIINKTNAKYKNITFLKKAIDKRHLTQLLLNTLSNSNTSTNDYNNITGKLYYTIKAKSSKDNKTGKPIVWKYITLEYKIGYYDFKTMKLCLLNEVKTFTNLKRQSKMDFSKKPLEKYPHYEINPKSRKMHRVKSGTFGTKTYIIKQVEGQKKSLIDFIDFSSWKKFKDSKCGILYKFKNDIDTKLSDYITKFELSKLADNSTQLQFDTNTTVDRDLKIDTFYRTLPIVINFEAIQSSPNKEKAQQLANSLIKFLTDPNKNYQVPPRNINIGKIDKDAINLRIIHREKYYKTKKIKDPKNDFKGQQILIQHITLEDFIPYENASKNENKENFQFVIPTNAKGNSSPTLDNLFKELYIKQDIFRSRITLTDWKLNNWKFVVKETIKLDEDTEKDIFHSLAINNEGVLSFEKFNNERKKEYRQYKTIFQEYDKNNYRHKVEGLVISPVNDINVIIKTDLHTIPDFKTIGDKLKNTSSTKEYPKRNVIKYLETFIRENPKLEKKEKDNINTLFTILEHYRDSITKEELNQILTQAGLNNRTNFKKQFTSYFEQQTGDTLANFFQRDRNKVLMSNIYIQYRVSKNRKNAVYFVGEKIGKGISNLGQKIPKAAILRKVCVHEGNLVFENLLHTMNVDFVRNGALTVMPYPFKYLREKIKM